MLRNNADAHIWSLGYVWFYEISLTCDNHILSNYWISSQRNIFVNLDMHFGVSALKKIKGNDQSLCSNSLRCSWPTHRLNH